MAFWRKKEEKKKFDYSDETKELFAERDAFYAEQRRKLGGGSSNPELSNQPTEESKPKEENLDDLLGGGDFNPYVNKEDTSTDTSQSIASSPPPSSSAASGFVCVSCGKDFQEKWGKCPSCGGEMKKVESSAAPEPDTTPSFTPSSESTQSTPIDTSDGDPLDDLLGDFGTSDASSSLFAPFGNTLSRSTSRISSRKAVGHSPDVPRACTWKTSRICSSSLAI